LNEEAVGYYSPGYDLAFQSLTLVLTVINTAAYPLAVKALASGGPETARRQLQENGELVATAALVGCATLIVLAPSIVLLLIGEAFRPTSLALLPIVAIAAALAGIKAYHFDTAFHLGEQSHVLVYISSLAAIVNIGLNLVLIPKLGVLGAAWGTLGAYACALILSVIAARRAFPMPATGPLLAKSATTALFVSLAISCPAMVAAPVIYRLPVGLVLGLLAFVIAVIVFDISDARRVTCVIIRRFQVRFNNVRSGK
jgi:O-antigen/teichoic acid export membrane protein